MNRTIESIRVIDSPFFKEYYKKLVLQNFRNNEQNKVTQILKDVEYSDPLAINGMFNFRQRDEIDKIDQELEAMHEHKLGLLDPKNIIDKSKKK